MLLTALLALAFLPSQHENQIFHKRTFFPDLSNDQGSEKMTDLSQVMADKNNQDKSTT